MTNEQKYRKQEIKDLAESIALEYFPEKLIDPEVIADASGITYSYGHYLEAFDGLIQHRAGRFHIFLNLDRNPDAKSPRMRYTFGHETGHYFIDEHRNALISGRVREHPSFNPPDTRNVAEAEAEYFSSCLLLPEKKYRAFCYKRPLSGALLEEIAIKFQVSLTAVCYKYLEISLFPMALVMSQNGSLKWHQTTPDFKYPWFPKWNTPLPPNTAAAEYFRNGRTYKTEEIVFADDWFTDLRRVKDEQFWEKCIYLPSNKVLSILWKKEKQVYWTFDFTNQKDFQLRMDSRGSRSISVKVRPKF
jgi:hypothetical protein